jgi:uncharacterized membrane protein
MSSINDLGTFDQAVWGTLHGDFFLNTHNMFNVPINYFGIHFRPILLIFLPFYALLPRPEWMILSQSLALSLTAWAIYLLAKRVSKSETAAFFWVIIYMINPFVMSVPPWIFRPISLAVPFIIFSMLAIEESNFPLLLISCFFIVLCKEHLGIMVIGFGILWVIRNRKWKQGILLVSFGAIYTILVLGAIMPALSPTGEHVMLGKGLGQVSRYSWLGGSLKEVFQTLLFHPIFVIKTAMLKMGGGNYLLLLLIFLCGLPLVAPEFILPGLADLSANMLSANPMPRAIIAYHTVCLVPVIIVAAVYGAERISRWSKKNPIKELASFVLIVSLVGGYFLSPLPLPGARNFWKPAHFINLPDPIVKKVRSAVGKEASVSAQANIGSHFSQRRNIYLYPNKLGEVDAIILRLRSPTNNINNLPEKIKKHRKYVIGSLDAHLQMDRTEYIASIESLLSNSEYKILLWNDPWLVMKRGVMNREAKEVAEVEQRLAHLRIKWQIDPGENFKFKGQ